MSTPEVEPPLQVSSVQPDDRPVSGRADELCNGGQRGELDMLVSVCICTRNRPLELERALASVDASRLPAHQIVVADDSDDGRARALIERRIRSVAYVQGPRRGLGANRNRALARATGTHLLFLDDDAELGSDFLDHMRARLAQITPEQRASTIITGVENKLGHLVYAHEQSVLGFQHRPYKEGEEIRTVVINATVFPRQLFDVVLFDPALRYGYDEVDLTTRALSRGYRIVSCCEAVNRHSPSPVNRDEYRPVVDASRLYVTFKRRRHTEGSALRGWLGLVLGACHFTASTIRRRGPHGVPAVAGTLRLVYQYNREWSSNGTPSGG